MKLVWCPDTAVKAYVAAVKALAGRRLDDTSVAELVAAMAGGWGAQLVVEAWAHDAGPATSLALDAAVQHTGGRHVCVVPTQEVAAQYDAAAEVLVGDAGEAMAAMEGVDLVVVDCRRRDAGTVMRAARPGARGMVMVCKGAAGVRKRCGAAGVLAAGTRLVRRTYLPIGSGVEVLHVGVGKGPSLGGRSRWIRHVDHDTKEEHVFRRR
ncbi:uncharacterized protein LOC141842037 [Curcuma longa]|uniref:uncharacterized protein LOC141842037 n=1 Tax=Curcuma longa TaxID=136217 RepID=UPI003D9EAB5D